MIVCHCNCIQSACIKRCASELNGAGPGRPITPVAVYHGLGKRPCCGGCLPLAAQLIAEHLATITESSSRSDVFAASMMAAE